MSIDNVRQFSGHAPSGDDGEPLYTTPQERDLFCFDQGYRAGQADAATLYAAEAEGEMRRSTHWGIWLIALGFALAWVAFLLAVFVVGPLVRWWLS